MTFKKMKNKMFEDLLNNPRYKQKVEKLYKVRKREQEKEEAETEIRAFRKRPELG